jgi:hypothetical protein
MSTPIKRIEKDFLLKILYDEQIPLVYLRNRREYLFVLENPPRTELCIKALSPVPGLNTRRKLALMFDYRGQVISFVVEPSSIRDAHVRAPAPEFFYKNLNRSYSRVGSPPDLEVQFTFLEDRYSLSYPRVTEVEYEDGELGELIKKVDTQNLNGLIAQITTWIKGCAGGHKLVLFRDELKNLGTEERIITEMGKALYLPVVQNGLPQEDPYPRKRLVTGAMFRRFLESTGVVGDEFVEDTAARFIRAKFDAGLRSEIWMPILFQEYVIGYIHIWAGADDGKAPFNFGTLDTLYQFAKILAFSLKVNGYFDKGRLQNDPIEGRVIDISASGLLFAQPHSSLSHSLQPESELALRLIAPGRQISTSAWIVRRYQDQTMDYFGCRFGLIEPDDLRFLFEFIYGRPFTDADAQFLAGQV